MRALPWLFAALAGCHPSATVENTMPVANLQSYRTVAVRVHTQVFASQGKAMSLEAAVFDKLRQKCGFEQVGRPGQTPVDVMIDLDIINTGIGGGGWISNSNVATIDTLLVLTDGQDGEILGTARIHGKSSGMIINNAPPESEAIAVVAKTVAEMLAKSGCGGPRIARAKTPPPPPGPEPGTGSNTPAPPDETRRAEAEALNDQGKEKLYASDLPGALALFQQAFTRVPDARYEFNVCLTLGVQEQWDHALAACRQARGLNPEPKLATRIDHRIDLLEHHQ